MSASCDRALRLGVPAVAFTEHVDHTVWRVALAGLAPDDHLARMSTDGLLHPPPFDAAGYLAEIEACRSRYPDLRILSGVELGEPHRHPAAVTALLSSVTFDRVLGSLHSLIDRDGYAEPTGLFEHRDAAQVLRDYLAEVAQLACSSIAFEVLAHIDYPVRSWPGTGDRFEPQHFEEEFRHALRTAAAAGRALELSTKVPLHATILRWWREEGGKAISFGSDAHDPGSIARGFAESVQLAEAHGFHPGRTPCELWGRSRLL
jgi:histidinol-phosphatase (PHP family)